MTGVVCVLVTVVVGNVVLQALLTRDAGHWSYRREQHQSRELFTLMQGLVADLEATRRAEIEARRHADDLQHDLSVRELAHRATERLQAMQIPPVQSAEPAWMSQPYDGDPDPTNIGAFIDRLDEPSTYAEQLDGGYQLPPDHEKVVMVAPGETLIPGVDE